MIEKLYNKDIIMFSRYSNAFIFIARILMGGIFIGAGWMKVADMSFTVESFASMGLSAFFAYLISYAEIAGGVALVIGLWAELAAAGLAIIMIGATYFGYKMSASYGIPVFQAVMPTLGLLSGLLSLASSGAGKWAIRFGKRDTAPSSTF